MLNYNKTSLNDLRERSQSSPSLNNNNRSNTLINNNLNNRPSSEIYNNNNNNNNNDNNPSAPPIEYAIFQLNNFSCLEFNVELIFIQLMDLQAVILLVLLKVNLTILYL